METALVICKCGAYHNLLVGVNAPFYYCGMRRKILREGDEVEIQSRRSMKEKIVCVEWDDASFNSGYYDKKTPEDFRQVKTKTVGHLVKRSAKEVLLAVDRFYKPDGKLDSERHITTIPRKMIRKITYLKEE